MRDSGLRMQLRLKATRAVIARLMAAMYCEEGRCSECHLQSRQSQSV